MTVVPRDQASLRTKRRIRRHGSEYDIILEHSKGGEWVPMGLLCKSRKTGQYVWFSRSKIITMHDETITHNIPVPELIEGIDTCTPDKKLLIKYLDYLMSNKLSKRDQKKFGPLYENVKADQFSLMHRINNL